MPLPESGWPPEYILRRSKKARRVSLRVTHEKGLELVLPLRVDAALVPEVLEHYKGWILRRLARRDEFRRDNAALQGSEEGSGASGLPKYFYLHGGLVRVDLDWRPEPGNFARKKYITRTMEAAAAAVMQAGLNDRGEMPRPVSPPPGDPSPVFLQQVSWSVPGKELLRGKESLSLCLAEYARCYLGERLQLLSARHSLAYKSLRVGRQKSRWGSYSARGCISLNAKLAFLPPELSDYVILHELCHSMHLAHDKKFWEIMQIFNPLSRHFDKKLSSSSIWIPYWFS